MFEKTLQEFDKVLTDKGFSFGKGTWIDVREKPTFAKFKRTVFIENNTYIALAYPDTEGMPNLLLFKFDTSFQIPLPLDSFDNGIGEHDSNGNG